MSKIIFEKASRKKRDYKAEFEAELRAYCQRAGVSVAAEYKFHPTRQFTFDWALVELKIGFEFEGGMFGATGARRCPVCKQMPKASHFAIDRIKRDAEKYNLAAIRGWRVIRILPTIVSDGQARFYIEQAVAAGKLDAR